MRQKKFYGKDNEANPRSNYFGWAYAGWTNVFNFATFFEEMLRLKMYFFLISLNDMNTGVTFNLILMRQNNFLSKRQ